MRRVSRVSTLFKDAPEHIVKQVALMYKAEEGKVRIVYRDRDGVNKIIGNTFSTEGRADFFLLDDAQYKALRVGIRNQFIKWADLTEKQKTVISSFVERAA